MQKDQVTGPDAPRPPKTSVTFRTVPTYGASVTVNGRYSPLLSRVIGPLGRIVVAWFEWRAKRRARSGSRPA